MGLAARGRTVIDFVLLLGKLDGSDAYITTSAGPVRDEEANVVGAFVIFRDVTEQVFFEKREEEMAEALRAANERFRQKVRAAEDAARRERTLREKLQAQEKLHARLGAILDATSDYVGTADSEERLLYHNRAALRMLGIREGEDITGR